MEHVVFYPASDGTPAFRRLASLEEAVGLVEHLRNVEGVAQVSVHALTEVPLAFRAYYRVEVPSQAEAPQADAPQLEPVQVEVPAQVPAVEPVAVEAPALALVEEPAEEPEPQPVLAASNGHATPTSLGFFA